MIAYVIAGIVGAVLYSLGALALKMIKEGGMAEQKAKEAEKSASISKDQAEIIAQPKSLDETIADLDGGNF